jgi:FtsH-binding integral membrane protein
VLGFVAVGAIVVSIFFDWSLGIFFTVAMIALMGGYILYYTSVILHHYDTDMHVAAALALFAAIATLFWWILRLLLYVYASWE